jgi:GT2 family glycosyltransferase
LKEEFSGITLIKSERNAGMGAGNNIGATTAKGEYLLILNPDTELHKDALKTMFDYLKANVQTGLVGPKLIYPDGERQVSCYRYPNILLPFLRRTILGRFNKKYLDSYLMNNANLDEIQRVDWLMGSCFLLKKELFDQLGGFDERFFMYFEDTDLCKRINDIGLEVRYLPTATVIHHHGRASAKHHWLWSVLANKMARVHLISYLKYFNKWGL